ncbi:MAG: divalent-cation tolerance protein CutA [Steroidobacteraceae bacterium]
MTDGLVVLCTCPDDPAADRIARALVAERLAACVSRTALRSTYRWEDAVHDEPEVLLVIKTTRARLEQLEVRLQALHPYDLPEFLALPVTAGSERYLAWIAAETRPPSASGASGSGVPGSGAFPSGPST